MKEDGLVYELDEGLPGGVDWRRPCQCRLRGTCRGGQRMPSAGVDAMREEVDKATTRKILLFGSCGGNGISSRVLFTSGAFELGW